MTSNAPQLGPRIGDVLFFGRHVVGLQMRFNNILIPAVTLLILFWAYDSMQWMGVGLALSAMVTWLLLHYTRLIHIFNKASKRPIGYVDSAVMMHVKIKKGMPLLKVIALTKSLGKKEGELSNPPVDPEVYTWTDASESTVRCVFMGGRLSTWDLHRPQQHEEISHNALESA